MADCFKISTRNKGVERWAAPLFFAAAAVALTWPLAASPGEALCLRGDYFLNLWNFWWVDQCLFSGSESLYFTDYLHYPLGISLAKHVLSPVNSIPGALLGRELGLHDSYKLLLLIHFWLSGWFFALFARQITGSRAGSILAGIFYSFCPFHYYYLAQLNVATMEFLPLAGYFLVKAYRGEGGLRVIGGATLAAVLLAGSSSYYVVYMAFLGILLLAGGKVWEPSIPFKKGAIRMAAAGLCAGIAVFLVMRPTVLEALSSTTGASETPQFGAVLEERSNDLAGFSWVGPPESATLSWPAMIGYSALLLLLAGLRRDRRFFFWFLLAGLFWVFSLGPTLQVGGKDLGISLPYSWLSDVPLLGMLRKPDRIFVMVQLCLGVLLAFSWDTLARRLSSAAVRRAAWSILALLMILELHAAPLKTYQVPHSSELNRLRNDEASRSLLDLPFQGGRPQAAWYTYFQTIHEKKIPQGYVVNLAFEKELLEELGRWFNSQGLLSMRRGGAFKERLKEQKIDLVLLHKQEPAKRPPGPIDKRTLWLPFSVHRSELIGIRQQGHLVQAPMEKRTFESYRTALSAALGEPLFEDDSILLYRL